MTSRTKAKSAEAAESSEQDTAADDTVKDDAQPLCGTVHPLPLLSHVTCQRTTGHTDDPPQGCDQGKHHARVSGTAYRW